MTARDAALVAVAVLSVGVASFVVQHPPVIPRQAPRVRLAPSRVVPQEEVPQVEPLKLVDMTRGEAEAFNASVPFSTEPNPAARPFKLQGTPDDLARATDCLAVGVLYEAGDDDAGERAVAQVMLNRVRHPAFPKTVCGVVFAGSDRSTGCQFSFTCDGSLDRWHPTPDQWMRARAIASAALGGAVYRPVGYATHYHTDWVVPYWQSSLDKVVAVHSHLFFRWTGWWGTPPAFRRQVQTGEPVIAKLAAISPAHGMNALILDLTATPGETGAVLGKPIAPLTSDPDSFVTTLDPQQPPETYQALAVTTCGDRAKCRVMGWTDPQAAASTLPLNGQQIAALSFSYLRDRSAGIEKSLWNCAEFKRSDRRQCLKRQLLVLDSIEPTPAATPVPPAPDPLDGVHHRTETFAPRVAPAERAPAAAKQPARAPITPPGTSPAATP